MSDLFPEGVFKFVHDGGKEYRDGKVYWPSSLHVEIEHHEVLQMLGRMASYLQRQNVKGEPPMPFSLILPGAMEKVNQE